MPKVVVDPGHAATDPGAVGNGLKEKDLTLKTGLFLRDILAADDRYQVKMTRETDQGCRGLVASTGPELSARAAVANEWGADFLVAIHFNSYDAPAHGVEALDYDGSGLGAAVAVALCQILAESEGLTNRGVHHTNKSFAVIRETNCPAIISETAFISNAADIAHFDTDAELKKLAWYHYVAICQGFGLAAKGELNPDAEKPAADPLADALQKLHEKGITSSPEYWLDVVQSRETLNQDYLAQLLQNMAKAL